MRNLFFKTPLDNVIFFANIGFSGNPTVKSLNTEHSSEITHQRPEIFTCRCNSHFLLKVGLMSTRGVLISGSDDPPWLPVSDMP